MKRREKVTGGRVEGRNRKVRELGGALKVNLLQKGKGTSP